MLEDLKLGTLADYHFWNVNGQISEHVIKYVTMSVMSGVSFIHSKSIIFLGVNPHHIGIDSRGFVKLVNGFNIFLLAKKRLKYAPIFESLFDSIICTAITLKQVNVLIFVV